MILDNQLKNKLTSRDKAIEMLGEALAEFECSDLMNALYGKQVESYYKMTDTERRQVDYHLDELKKRINETCLKSRTRKPKQ